MLFQNRSVTMQMNSVQLEGDLWIPEQPEGLVIFAHGSGSSRKSPRNQQVARVLNESGLATFLFDLLTEEESRDRSLVFNIPFLANRLLGATGWIRKNEAAEISELSMGYFGASTGGGAALWAAAEAGDRISAVVSRGGRPDLALERLHEVKAPTLLLVGGDDSTVIEMNKQALAALSSGKLVIIPGASHLFEEPGTLEQVAEKAAAFFHECFRKVKKVK